MRFSPASFAVLVALASASSGCLVLRKDLEKSQAETAQARAGWAMQKQSDDARVADLSAQLAAAQAASQDRDAKIADLSTATHNLQAQLDEATAVTQSLKDALERMGKDADKLLAERGTLSKALDDAKTRLDELRKAQAAAEERAALLRELARRFQPLIDAGQMRVGPRHGQLTVALAGDLLFEPGKAEIRAAGRGALMELAKAIETTPASPALRRMLVVGHVDEDKPKKVGKTLLDLTAARAATIVDYLVSLGVHPETLVAAGAGATDPVAPNDTPENRALNRRVELSLWPDDALPR